MPTTRQDRPHARQSRPADVAPRLALRALPAPLLAALAAAWRPYADALNAANAPVPVLWPAHDVHDLPRAADSAGVLILQAYSRRAPLTESTWRDATTTLIRTCRDAGVVAVVPPPVWFP